MTTLLDRGSSSSHTVRSQNRTPRLPPFTRNRRPVAILASSVLVFASIAIFADMYASTDRQTSVLIVTESIEQGQQFSGSELGQASASISGGVSAIPVSDASELEGKRAAVTIPAGSLLTTGDITDSQLIAAGDAVVGMALKSGQLPSAGVEPGDDVMIVQTGSLGASLDLPASPGAASGDAGTATGVLVPQAEVYEVETPPANSESTASQLVSVEVSTTLAAAVSTAAAADQVSLVLLPSGYPRSGLNGQGVVSPRQRTGSSTVRKRS